MNVTPRTVISVPIGAGFEVRGVTKRVLNVGETALLVLHRHATPIPGMTVPLDLLPAFARAVTELAAAFQPAQKGPKRSKPATDPTDQSEQ